MKLWKTLNAQMCSQVGDLPPWELGVWRKCNPPVKVYKSGFHASRNIIDAMYNNPQTTFLCSVEVQGEHDKAYDGSMEAWSEMRVLHAWEWTKEDSVALAVYAADLVYKYFEKACPLDGRPRKAIFAAKAWLINPTEKNRKDAEEAAETCDEIGWIAANEFDRKYKSVLAAARAARNAAKAAACNASLSIKYALDAVIAAEDALAQGEPLESLEKRKKLRLEVRNKCHEFVLKRLTVSDRPSSIASLNF